jgi:hypothetical protein
MSDVTEVGGEDGDKAEENKAAKKASGQGGNGVDAQISRMLVRALWAQDWIAANPDATIEARKAAWELDRQAMLEKNFKTYRRAIASMQRAGVTMTLNQSANRKGDTAD